MLQIGDRAQFRLHRHIGFVCLHRHSDRRSVKWFNIQFLRKTIYENQPAIYQSSLTDS